MDGEHVQAQQVQLAQVEHHLRHAPGQERLDRRMSLGSVGQDVDQAGHFGVDALPVGHRRARQARGMGDRRDVEQKVGGASESRVHYHGVVKGVFGQDLSAWDLAFV